MVLLQIDPRDYELAITQAETGIEAIMLPLPTGREANPGIWIFFHNEQDVLTGEIWQTAAQCSLEPFRLYLKSQNYDEY